MKSYYLLQVLRIFKEVIFPFLSPWIYTYSLLTRSKMFGIPDRYSKIRIVHDLWKPNPKVILPSNDIL